MQAIYSRIAELGGQVRVISFSSPGRVKAFLDRHPLPFPVVADPDRKAYAAFSLGKTSWSQILRPASIFRYVGLMFRGWRPHASESGDDLMQLGGDFVLDRNRRLVFAYPSREPTDRPSSAILLRAIEQAAG